LAIITWATGCSGNYTWCWHNICQKHRHFLYHKYAFPLREEVLLLIKIRLVYSAYSKLIWFHPLCAVLASLIASNNWIILIPWFSSLLTRKKKKLISNNEWWSNHAIKMESKLIIESEAETKPCFFFLSGETKPCESVVGLA
jgi:hypothetical protein